MLHNTALLGLSIGSLIAGAGPQIAEGADPKTRAEIAVLFKRELTDVQGGKLPAGEAALAMLAGTENPAGKDAALLRGLCEEALRLVAKNGSEQDVTTCVQRLTAAKNPNGGELFDSTSRKDAILIAAMDAAGSGKIPLAFGLIELLATESLLTPDETVTKKAEALAGHPLPHNAQDRMNFVKTQVRWATQVFKDGHSTAANIVSTSAQKNTPRLPMSVESSDIRTEARELYDVLRAKHAVDSGKDTKQDHQTLGLFLLSQGDVPGGFRELEAGGHSYAQKYPLSGNADTLLATAKKIEMDVARAGDMKYSVKLGLANICSYLGTEALRTGTLMNGGIITAERYAKMRRVPQPVSIVASKITPLSPSAATTLTTTLHSPTTTDAKEKPISPPERANLTSVPEVVRFFAGQGCIVEMDMPDRTRIQLTANAAIPTNGNLYAITVPPKACTPIIVKALSEMTVSTRINMFDCPLGDPLGVPFFSKLTQKQGALALRRTGIGDITVRSLPKDADIGRLDLTGTFISNDGLGHLANNAKLPSLVLGNTLITDQGFLSFRDKSHLKHLEVSSTAVTGAVLQNLSGNKDLEILKMNSCKVTDADLKHVAQFPKLKTLDLGNTGVTPAGLGELLPLLPELKELTISKIYPSEQAYLEQKAPKGCKITVKK